MSFCTSCGVKVETAFCANCGTKAERANPQSATTSKPPTTFTVSQKVELGQQQVGDLVVEDSGLRFERKRGVKGMALDLLTRENAWLYEPLSMAYADISAVDAAKTLGLTTGIKIVMKDGKKYAFFCDKAVLEEIRRRMRVTQ